VKYTALNNDIYNYIQKQTPNFLPLLQKLREETAQLKSAGMQISADQGAFMHLMTKLIGSKRAIEVGCFTGYSALSVASALPSDGKLFTFDVSEEYTSIATKYFKESGLDKKIELRLAPALESLSALLSEFGERSFDQAFIDADKENYLGYYEACLKLLRPGGLMMIDNVIWGGAVADSSNQEESTKAIRKLNNFIRQDGRVETSFLSLSDGLYLVRKK